MAIEKFIEHETGRTVSLKLHPKGTGAKYDDRFSLIFRRAAQAIAMNKNLKLKDLQIMLLLLDELDFEAWREVNQSKLADALETSQPTVSRSITRLLNEGIIEKMKPGGSGYGKSCRYRMHHWYFWRGTVGQYRQLKKRHRDALALGADKETGEL